MKKPGGLTKKKLTVHLGETLRAARARMDWTQADVAERVGVATEVYGRMERGNLTPSVPNLRALCLVLRMDADSALGLESAEKAAWLQEPAPVEEETPRMRRLMRALRQLDQRQLAVMSIVVRTLALPLEDPELLADLPTIDDLAPLEEPLLEEPVLEDPPSAAESGPSEDKTGSEAGTKTGDKTPPEE